MSFAHLVGDHVAVQVHGRPDVRVTHQLLLHSDPRSDCIEPTPARVPQGMRTELRDSSLTRRISEAQPQVLRVQRRCLTRWQNSIGRRVHQFEGQFGPQYAFRPVDVSDHRCDG